MCCIDRLKWQPIAAGRNLDVQLQKLQNAGCSKLFEEKKSAAQGSSRPRLEECLDWVREGDTLVISRLDRVARSVLDLASIADKLKSKGVDLRVLDQGIDTSTTEGRLMFNMLGAFAEFENDLRRERQQEGIERAKAKGVRFGRKRNLTEGERNQIQKMREKDGLTIEQLQNRFRVGRSTIYRALRREVGKPTMTTFR